MNKLSFVTEKIKKHKKLTIVLIIVLVVAICGGTIASNMNKKKEQMMAMMNQTQTSKVERRTLVSSVSATGVLTSVNSKDIVVDLNGVEVKSVSVELGDMVEDGQIICEFDSENIEKNLAEAKSALNVTNQKTQMDLAAAERNLAEAKEDYDTDLKRANTDLGLVYNEYVVSLEEVEEAEANLSAARGSTNEKKQELELKERQLKEAQEALSTLKSSSTNVELFESKKQELEGLINSYNSNPSYDNKITLDMDKINLTNTEPNFGWAKDELAEDENADEAVKECIEALKNIQSEYQKEISDAEAKLESFKQEVSNLQTKYNTAKSNESNLEKTYEQAVSASQSKLQSYDKQKRSVEDTEKSVENNLISKTNSLTTAQLNAINSGNSEEDKVEEYQQQLEDCNVKAPFSGVVSAVNIEAGDTYNGTAIVTIDDISSFEVTAQIDEYEIGKIKKGQNVVIKTNATGDEELEGTVKIVSPKSSGSGNEVTYTVIISVDTPNEMLRMDMTAKLSIIIESKENVLTVPYEAVQEGENGKYYVEVVDKSGEDTANSEVDKKQMGFDKGNMPERMDFENMPEMPEGMNFEGMPGVSKGMSNRDKQKISGGINVENSNVPTRRIYVEKGIESDYYIEIISSEITEGMEVVVPKTEAENGGNIQMMMMRQGPMGGF